MFENLECDLVAAHLHNANSPSRVDQNITIWLHYGMQAVVCYRFGRWLRTFAAGAPARIIPHQRGAGDARLPAAGAIASVEVGR